MAGCEHHCKGCQNPQTWDYNNGKPFTYDTLNTLIALLNKPYIKGLTISGGDPLAPANINTVLSICKYIKDYTYNKDIWIYTGYKFEEISDNIKKYVDAVVDGEFELNNRDITLRFRGSTNQKIWHKNINGYWYHECIEE